MHLRVGKVVIFRLLVCEVGKTVNIIYVHALNMALAKFHLSYNYTMRFIGYDSIQTR